MTDLKPREDAEVGVCAHCKQILLRTSLDCWHPWNVHRACPPAVDDNGMSVPAFGDGWGRPGRDAFVKVCGATYGSTVCMRIPNHGRHLRHLDTRTGEEWS